MAIDPTAISTFLRVNGITPTSPDDAIRGLLLKANYTEADIAEFLAMRHEGHVPPSSAPTFETPGPAMPDAMVMPAASPVPPAEFTAATPAQQQYAPVGMTAMPARAPKKLGLIAKIFIIIAALFIALILSAFVLAFMNHLRTT